MASNRLSILGIVTLSFTTGICLNEFVSIRFDWTSWGTLLLLLMTCFVKHHQRWVVTIGLLFVLLGALYSYSYQYLHRNHVTYSAIYYKRQPITVRGIIASDIKVSRVVNTDKYSFTLKIAAVKIKTNYRLCRGKVLVQLFRKAELSYGDKIEVTGKIHPPFEFSEQSNFSYKQYLRNKGIHHILSVKNVYPVTKIGEGRWAKVKLCSLKIRRHLMDKLSLYLTDNERGILQAMILGERSGIPSNVRELFNKTGTAHVLAISGLHVGLVVMFIMTFLNVVRFHRPVQLILTILLILCYLILTGGRPSVVRASIMAVALIAGFFLERESNSLNMLSLAALIILLINPLSLFDVGFQLSFVCILGIILMAPKIQCWLMKYQQNGRRKSFSYWVNRSLSVSMGVWFAIEGLIVYYFEIITPITVLANFVIIPMIILVVNLGFGLLIVAYLCPWLAVVFAACTKVVLNLSVAAIFLLSKIPYAYIVVRDINHWHLISYYLIIVMIFFVPWGIISKK